jgi:hypothetical protein
VAAEISDEFRDDGRCRAHAHGAQPGLDRLAVTGRAALDDHMAVKAGLAEQGPQRGVAGERRQRMQRAAEGRAEVVDVRGERGFEHEPPRIALGHVQAHGARQRNLVVQEGLEPPRRHAVWHQFAHAGVLVVVAGLRAKPDVGSRI